MHVIRKDSANPGPPPNANMFTGPVLRHTYVDETIGKRLRLGLVQFSPNGRTKWHTHDFEQGLYIIEGKGIVATEEHEHVVEPGDIVIIPEGEKHWHGASETTAMSHIAINGPGSSFPTDPVTEVKTKL